MKTLPGWMAKWVLFAALLGAALWSVFFIFLPPDYTETFAILHVKLAALRAASSPKVIILGGSNALYGIDSGLLAQRLGRPVVNLSLQVGVPLSMQMNQIEPYLQPGDLVVMSLEYGYYVYPDGSPASLARLLEVYPQGVWSLDAVNLKQLPDILKTMFQAKVNRLQSGTSPRTAPLSQALAPGRGLPESMVRLFSPQGDLLAHLDQPGKPIEPTPFFGYNQLAPRAVELVNQVGARVRARGAAAVLTFPSGRQTNCAATAQTFALLEARLQAELTLPTAGTPESYCFPDAYFFDTSYHLLREGRRIRTEQMAVDLRPFLR